MNPRTLARRMAWVPWVGIEVWKGRPFLFIVVVISGTYETAERVPVVVNSVHSARKREI